MSDVPVAGDEFEVVASLDIAREKAEACAESLWMERISAKAGDGKVTLSSLASAVSSRKLSGLDLHQLNIILKVDVQVCILVSQICYTQPNLFLDCAIMYRLNNIFMINYWLSVILCKHYK